MNNNQLIERKENIFTKIKNFFRGLFSKKKEYNCTNSIAQNIQETEPNNIEKVKVMENSRRLYEKSKKGEVDLLSLSPDTLKKMCALLEEEIKMKEKNNEIKREKLNAY